MFRRILLASVMLLVAAQGARAQNAPKFKTVIMPDAVRFVDVFSEDKQVCSMLFDNLILGTGAGIAALPNAEIKKFTYAVRPETEGEACVVQHIRGYVSTQGKASAMMVVHAGGKTTLIDFAKAIQADKENTISADRKQLREKAKTLAKSQGLTVDGRPKKSDNFFVEIKTHVSPGEQLQTSLVLLVDRPPTAESGAAIHVDSVDFGIYPVVKK